MKSLKGKKKVQVYTVKGYKVFVKNFIKMHSLLRLICFNEKYVLDNIFNIFLTLDA